MQRNTQQWPARPSALMLESAWLALPKRAREQIDVPIQTIAAPKVFSLFGGGLTAATARTSSSTDSTAASVHPTPLITNLLLLGWPKRTVRPHPAFSLVSMSISVEVVLLSGLSTTIHADLSSRVESVREQAQTALGLSRGRLLSASGAELNVGSATLGEAEVRSGDVLTLHARPVQVAAYPPCSSMHNANSAFAAILGDGAATGWGCKKRGGDSGAVQHLLENVQSLQASHGAFAAVLHDGSLVTWGDPGCGGDCSDVAHRLRDVHQIQASGGAFAAILGDGSVVTWGDQSRGGNSSAVQQQLCNVQRIQSNRVAFAAITAKGSVVTWGSHGCGGDSSSFRNLLQSVQHLQSTSKAFAALRCDGSVVTWGSSYGGGDSSLVQAQLTNVQQIQASEQAFAHPGRWLCRDVGSWDLWWRQRRSPKSAGECAAGSSNSRGVRSSAIRWVSCDLG